MKDGSTGNLRKHMSTKHSTLLESGNNPISANDMFRSLKPDSRGIEVEVKIAKIYYVKCTLI